VEAAELGRSAPNSAAQQLYRCSTCLIIFAELHQVFGDFSRSSGEFSKGCIVCRQFFFPWGLGSPDMMHIDPHGHSFDLHNHAASK